ncbi:ComEA family DNA-binding protein [Thiofilum flexile]|uniref:ComEA family DNA-binding protein n=1 Tax=Thiofilum flexile TaxID=125627 RepID=UPI00036FF692|nr:helix-hairpin-helix domain-containing protein [Thiofilum flexile]
MLKKIIQATLLVLSLSSSAAVLAELVNINTADTKTIQDNLKGIGEKKAKAIIDYRTEKGSFKTLEEIQEVKGIGPKLFEKIKADISLTEGLGTTKPTPASSPAPIATTTPSTTPVSTPSNTPAPAKPVENTPTPTSTVAKSVTAPVIKTDSGKTPLSLDRPATSTQ